MFVIELIWLFSFISILDVLDELDTWIRTRCIFSTGYGVDLTSVRKGEQNIMWELWTVPLFVRSAYCSPLSHITSDYGWMHDILDSNSKSSDRVNEHRLSSKIIEYIFLLKHYLPSEQIELIFCLLKWTEFQMHVFLRTICVCHSIFKSMYFSFFTFSYCVQWFTENRIQFHNNEYFLKICYSNATT